MLRLMSESPDAVSFPAFRRNMAELLAMAMAVDDDDMNDGNVSVSSLDLNPIGSNESGYVPPSPEDVAWADSCLINDLAISDHGVDYLKHALPDAFTIFSAVMRDESPQQSRIFRTVEETGISGIVDDTIYDKDTESFWSRIISEDDFSPAYNEDLRLVEASDFEVDSENLDDDIFKVWELDIPDEEDMLVKLLNKALAGDLTPSGSENLGVVDDKLLDDIIAGLGDLSLNQSNH
ncbi:uncharacterized protein LOC132599230 isoform X1 [Lycium barbarum]|uniref:uncharacterized protein LOC132599230 isoform X1 n=2 Tax=Lycium barbarum TaxID=112863 RepID=UPI00293F08DE|nr:uncharacterized protein LOC132599230 isoform X1 [Lycium barbarum]XP_060168497.1 uncharacterized protein LOC132599230 isoform X1 [Lycium barbarum]XP_060168498.1 uncharacterized protein LOC132599230 isoform X1 [Lycium barbarum]XP_060168499.1 uncharacterized protein LOC132599230 isoform X1 [Lycium barbarum]XP_060168500.1 uncharacterized protein LOC132599230 isoform X1 [Lycium barbarum]